MNTGFYEDLDINFEQAYELIDKNISHDLLLDFLKNGNIVQKQIAAIQFDEVKDSLDAEALISNLTGCDGKIREAVAFKINQLLNIYPQCRKYFYPFFKTFADATIDINANICRLIVDSVKLLKSDEVFAKSYTDLIYNYSQEALRELDKFIFRDKKYVINKQLFKLYWCLETLQNFYECLEFKDLKQLLYRSAEQEEYTIREKTAQIVLKQDEFKDLYKKLKSDENYYVRTVFKSS